MGFDGDVTFMRRTDALFANQHTLGSSTVKAPQSCRGVWVENCIRVTGSRHLLNCMAESVPPIDGSPIKCPLHAIMSL